MAAVVISIALQKAESGKVPQPRRLLVHWALRRKRHYSLIWIVNVM